MRARVIADDARAPLGVGDDRNAVAHPQRFRRHYPVRDQSRNGVERTSNSREFLCAGIVVEGPGVRDLAARFGVNDGAVEQDRKSTRLNSSHGYISYAVFC